MHCYINRSDQLKLHGVDVDQESQSISDPELLGAVMELREAIDEVATIKELDGIESHVTTKHDECIAALKDAFAKSDLVRAHEWTITLKYYTKLQEEVDDKKLRVR